MFGSCPLWMFSTGLGAYVSFVLCLCDMLDSDGSFGTDDNEWNSAFYDKIKTDKDCGKD